MSHGRIPPTWRPEFIAPRYAAHRGPRGNGRLRLSFTGSLLPAGGRWPVHHHGVFRGPRPGTVGTSLRRSQSRHLTGKALRYLKRVRVTPAVYRPLTRLNPGFRYRHWAGVTSGTHPFGLAGGYVFVKQSGPPSHCDPRAQDCPRPAGTPSPEVTGPICRVPSAGLPPHALGYSPRGPVPVLGTVAGDRSPLPFHGPRGSAEAALRPPHPGFRPVLAMTALPGRIPVGRGDFRGRPTPRRREGGLRCRNYPGGEGILTPFPFGWSELPPALGPTNPRLIVRAGEPFPLPA